MTARAVRDSCVVQPPERPAAELDDAARRRAGRLRAAGAASTCRLRSGRRARAARPEASSTSTPSTSGACRELERRSTPRRRTAHPQPPCARRVRQSSQRKNGPPASDGDDAERELDRRRRPCGRRGRRGRRAPRRRGALAGSTIAVRRPRGKPDEVRDDEADEGDRARPPPRRRPSRARARATRSSLAALGVDAEVRGLALAEGEQVELARPRAARRATPIATNGAVAPTSGHVAPPRLPSDQNTMSRSCASSARAISSPIARAGDRRHGDPGQDQRDRLRPALVARERVDDERRRGRRRRRPHSWSPPWNDRRRARARSPRRRRATRRSRRRSDRRVGERVPEDALESGAPATASAPPTSTPRSDPRQPDRSRGSRRPAGRRERRCRGRGGAAGSRACRPARSATAPTPTPSTSREPGAATAGPARSGGGPDEPVRRRRPLTALRAATRRPSG